MADSKTFTARFDLLDNFSVRYDAIEKRLKSIADKVIPINFEIDSSISGQVENINNKIEGSYRGVRNAVENTEKTTNIWNNSLGRAAGIVEQHTDAVKKADTSLSSLKSRFDKVGTSIESVKGKLAALTTVLAGGALMGFSWKAAEEANLYAESAYRQLASWKGARAIDEAALKDFVESAKRSGYTTSTDRLSLAYALATRGLKGTSKVTTAASNIEKVWYRDQELLEKEYGISSTKDLLEYASSPHIRGELAKQNLSHIFESYGIKDFGSKSQAERLKILARLDIDVDINEEMAKRPLDVIQNRLRSISRAVATELKGPMSAVANILAGFLGLIDKNPLLPKILAIAAGFVAVAGAVLGVVIAIDTVKKALLGLQMGSKLMSLGSMLLNPYALLFAIAAVILIVAYRTGVLQKAWEKFSNSAIGKDLLGALQGLANFMGSLIDQFSEWYESSGKDQMLGAFFTLVDVLGAAWDYVDRIYSAMTGAGASPILAGIAALGALPAAIGLAVVSKVTGKSPEEVMETISGNLQSLLQWGSAVITPIMLKIHDVLKTVWNVLYSLIQGALKWIRDGLGVTKAERKEKLEKAAEKAGLTYLDEASKYKSYQWWAGPGWYKTIGDNWKEKAHGSEVENLEVLRAKYENAPKGFFEAIPGINDLTQAIRDLIGPIERLIDALTGGAEGLVEKANVVIKAAAENTATTFTNALTGGAEGLVEKANVVIKAAAENTATTFTKAGIPATAVTSESKVWWDKKGNGITDEEYFKLSTQEKLSGKWRYDSSRSAAYAVGATFTKSGQFAGAVHSPEEIIPQATAQRGPGPIARALALLDSVTSRPSTPGQGSGSYTIHITNQNDFSGLRVSGSVDVEKLLSRIDKVIEAKSVEAVKKAIGQRRT